MSKKLRSKFFGLTTDPDLVDRWMRVKPELNFKGLLRAVQKNKKGRYKRPFTQAK
jgi:hypothetical protein